MQNGEGKRFDPITSFLIGIVVTGFGAFLAYPHDVVTAQQLDKQTQATNQSIDGLREEVAGLKYEIGDLKGQLKAQKLIQGP